MPLPRRLRKTLAVAVLSLLAGGTLATSAHALPDFDGDGVLPPADCNPLDGAVAPGRPDAPDLAFEDTNCDGIDGEAARAVFVSLGGSNAGTGSKENPLLTINAAVAKAKAEAKDVYIAGGTYAESVNLADGVGLFGGYTPITGARSATEVTTIAGVRQAALADGAERVMLQQLTLRGTPPGSGESAYGLRAINGSSVALVGVRTDPAPGSAGSAGATPPRPAAPDLRSRVRAEPLLAQRHEQPQRGRKPRTRGRRPSRRLRRRRWKHRRGGRHGRHGRRAQSRLRRRRAHQHGSAGAPRARRAPPAGTAPTACSASPPQARCGPLRLLLRAAPAATAARARAAAEAAEAAAPRCSSTSASARRGTSPWPAAAGAAEEAVARAVLAVAAARPAGARSASTSTTPRSWRSPRPSGPPTAGPVEWARSERWAHPAGRAPPAGRAARARPRWSSPRPWSAPPT